MGSPKPATVGTWYFLAYQHGLGLGPFDAFLEWRVGPKTAWSGSLTASGAIDVNEPHLLGGESDQGGVVGTLRVMFGEATQMPNAYLTGVFGDQTTAWRGFATVAWEGGKYGANNPYPQKPSYKIRKITKGWDDGCWYEATAEIAMGDGGSYTTEGHFAVLTPTPQTTGSPGGTVQPMIGTVQAIGQAAVDARNAAYLAAYGPTAQQVYLISVIYHAYKGTVAVIGNDDAEAYPPGAGVAEVAVSMVCPSGWSASSPDGQTVACTISADLLSMNPAHILYFLRTSRERGREPVANMADANLQAAADWFHSEGFGLCGTRKAASVSPAEYEQRICRIAGCSFTRSVVDGKFYIDIANGVYDLGSLPILTDDDVLSFKESPTVLDNAVNSVSVKYFDPVKKQTITTAPVRALGLIAEFGEIHQTYNFPEVPTAELAGRIALRELLAGITPTRKFELDCTATPTPWRRFQYFRAQLPKRGIADMVCTVGDIQHGKLKSGGIKLAAVQDIYSLPTTAYVQSEPGVDTRPPQTPVAITTQRAFESPYFELVRSLPRAELAALPADAGYLVAVAADPATSRDFTLMVADASAVYEDAGNGDFCPTATVVEVAGAMDTAFTLAAGKQLATVQVGAPVLWSGDAGDGSDDEWCRVDAIDAVAGTITLGRGCADTVPQTHAAGSRLFFYDDAAASDTTEYTDAESVDVKLLTNTGSQQLAESAATAMGLTFDQRQARPYPPANVLLDGQSYPQAIVLSGDLSVSAYHRDRTAQADQLVDQSMASIGPEVGTTYVVRNVDTLTETETYNATGISSWPHTVPAANLAVSNRLEVYSMRDGLESWQRIVVNFSLGQVLQMESGDPVTAEDGQAITLE